MNWGEILQTTVNIMVQLIIVAGLLASLIACIYGIKIGFDLDHVEYPWEKEEKKAAKKREKEEARAELERRKFWES